MSRSLKCQRVSEVLASLKGHVPAQGRLYVRDWQERIPMGSRWAPGCIGKPACPSCRGIGLMRLDLPLSHSYFGQLALCECVSETDAAGYKEWYAGRFNGRPI